MLLDFWISFFIVMLLERGSTTPIIEYDKGVRYEEYVIEHEISTIQAKNETFLIDINSITTPPGCQTCTPAEKAYCMGSDLINDHCCCDKRYHEPLKFIPHTCYMGTQLCKPVATDCAHYQRLRDCCCTKYALQKWKEKFGGSGSSSHHRIQLIFIFNIVNIVVIYMFA